MEKARWQSGGGTGGTHGGVDVIDVGFQTLSAERFVEGVVLVQIQNHVCEVG